METVINGDSKEYIAYLKTKFDPNKIEIIKEPDICINKPMKAFWGSPIDCKYSWKDYCDNEYNKRYKYNVRYTLKDNAKIFMVNNLNDIEELVQLGYMKNKYTKIDNNGRKIHYLDEWCIDYPNIPYDGIELTDACLGHFFINKKEMAFNSWDCECICIINKDIILFK